MPTDIVIPQLGESITEAEIVRWLKQNGEAVQADEPVVELETDKATAELPAPASGTLEILVEEGQTVTPGDVIGRIQEATAAAEPKPEPKTAPKPETAPKGTPTEEREPVPPETRTETHEPRAETHETRAETHEPRAETHDGRAETHETREKTTKPVALSPAVRRLVEEHQLDAEAIPASGPGGRLTKGDVLAFLDEARTQQQAAPSEPSSAEDTGAAAASRAARPAPVPRLSVVPSRQAPERETRAAPSPAAADADEERVRMSRLRRSIAQRLVEAQHTAAILTTFNEIDMSRVMEMRARFKQAFAERHGVSLGFMSFFARACVLALRDIPEVNARIEGDDIVYNRRVHLGIATSTDRGLVVPVVRDAHMMSLAELEREIGRLAELARTGKLGLDDLQGGTFTISNGGVFGSLMSTPILNPPQSGILGMHKIEKRPVVVDDEIVVRPMMYVALSYDHRLIDGREAVTFLVRVKERIEDPERLFLDI